MSGSRPHYVTGLPQLALGGVALLVGTINLVESVVLGERAAMPAIEWLPTVLILAVAAYWPFREGLSAAPADRRIRRSLAFAALVAVFAATFALSLLATLLWRTREPFPAQVAFAAVYGGCVAAFAGVCRIRALAVYAAVAAAATVLLAALEPRGLRLGVALPLLAGCLAVADGALRWSKRRAQRVPARATSRAVLPGLEAEVVRSAARRGMEAWFEDGTPELQLGGYALAAGLIYVLLSLSMSAELAALGLAATPFVLAALVGFGVLARRWFKERVTAPRTGNVEPRISRTATAVFVAAMAVLVAVGVAWPPVFGELWRGGHRLDVWPMEQLAMPILTGGLLAGCAAWSAWVSGVGTLYRVAAFALVLGTLLTFSSFRGYLGAGIVWLVVGAFLAADGALRMRRFVRRTSA
jgi:hypothetical protein